MTIATMTPVTVDNLFKRTGELLREQGCEEYVSVGWHTGVRRLGSTHEWFGRVYRITYSQRAMLTMSPEQIFDTMTHEVAHALVGGSRHGHDSVWKRKHRELGGSGEASVVVTKEEGMQMYKWVGRCRSCPNMFFRERMTNRARHGICLDCRVGINWHQNW
jgi:predicted SprT family Zn-dependent metalloprotease